MTKTKIAINSLFMLFVSSYKKLHNQYKKGDF